MFRSAEMSPGTEQDKESTSQPLLLAEALVLDKWNVAQGAKRNKLQEEQKETDRPDKPAALVNRDGSITFGSTNDNRNHYERTNPYGRSENNIDFTIKKTWNF